MVFGISQMRTLCYFVHICTESPVFCSHLHGISSILFQEAAMCYYLICTNQIQIENSDPVKVPCEEILHKCKQNSKGSPFGKSQPPNKGYICLLLDVC